MAVAPYRYHARVLVQAPAEEVRRLVTASSAVVEPVGPATCELMAGADDLRALVWHVGTLGFDLEVLEPSELRDAFAELADRFRAAAGCADR